MEGISKERLLELFKEPGHTGLISENELRKECHELNPWLPIDENTPKDKRLLVYFTCGFIFIARYDGKSWEIEDRSGSDEYYYYGQPIRYQELPDNPELGDEND